MTEKRAWIRQPDSKPCKRCGTLILRGSVNNYSRKKYCSNDCAIADRPFTPEQRALVFWGRVDKSAGPEACWLWLGAVTSKWGYGCIQVGGGRVLGAHKVAWMLTNGDPGALCVLHKCDNRVCVNPAHLFLGTKQDNSDDKVRKGRQSRGESSKRNKLTEVQVRELRRLREEEGWTLARLGEKFGIGSNHACQIVNRNVWEHVK